MYTAEISRSHPTALLFLLDQSQSMQMELGGGKEVAMQKDQAAADAINRTLYEFVMRCAAGDSIRNYFDVGVIGYGREKDWVGPVFEGALEGRDLVTIGDIANNPARVEKREKLVPDGAGGVVKTAVNFPIWFSPVSGWNTPMVATLEYAYNVLAGWVANHPECYPPIVINLSDGQSTDGDPTQAAQRLASLATDDGNVLLYNCHLSATPAPAIVFPDAETGLPDEFAHTLFRISSVFPESSRQYAQREGYAFTDTTRGFVFNADFVSLIKFLDIGTRTAQIRDV
jgi:hypothetical protein